MLEKLGDSSKIGLARLLVLADRYDLGEVEKALLLLKEVGPEAVESLLEGGECRSLVTEPRPAPVIVEDILRGIVVDRAGELPVPDAPTPAGQEQAILSELAASAERVEKELFWSAYLSAVQRLEKAVLQKWRFGEMEEGEAKALTWLLESLPKLTQLVRSIQKRHEATYQRLLTEEHWRRVKEKGRLKHE